jgi:uncharacterized cupredoxin-like copper-binding protein
MAVYFVLGSILVAWGLGLAALGLVRSDFPPSGPAGRALVGLTILIVAGTLTALLVTTDKEHPRREAAAKAAEHKAAPGAAASPTPAGATPAQQPSGPSGGGAKTVQVSEKEFSIALAGGNKLDPGSYKFAVANKGKIQHDLTIEGNGLTETKTPLIDAGQSKDLSVDLKPGKYKFYCSVPGHEQSGMKVAVTVGGGAKAAPKAKKPAAKPKPAAAKKKPAAAKTVNVAEKEFSIALAGGKTLNAGRFTFAVDNTGKIQHDLTIEGNGLKETKTPLIDAGQSKDLSVDLKPGKYKFYCSVPGHEQAGMKLEVTVK